MRHWVISIAILATVAMAAERKLEVNLNRRWLFRIGDDPAWAAESVDPAGWDEIRVGRCWEEQGYPGYDGYAWYRIRFFLGEALRDKALILRLGYIDDVDRVYVNGKEIGGRGSFPPEYQSAYNQERLYPLPSEHLKFGGENVIAIRVYDDEEIGGLVRGRFGIYSERRIRVFQDLAGHWRFRIGDDPTWKDISLDDSDWQTVYVPADWGEYGYADYDGYGWYRKHFIPNPEFKGKTLILALGRIDDIDEVYLNGIQIGRTGRFPGEKFLTKDNPYWNRERFYYIRSDILRWEKENVLAVRVYDIWRVGGIYQGPIGILTREEFMKMRRGNESFERWKNRLFEGWR